MGYRFLALLLATALMLAGCANPLTSQLGASTPASAATATAPAMGVVGTPTVPAASGAATATPAGTPAQPTCAGAACTGTDPQLTGCYAGAYTRESKSVSLQDGAQVAILELRESLACPDPTKGGGTQWARLQVLEAGAGAEFSYELTLEQPATGQAWPAAAYSGGQGVIFTPQAYSPDTGVRARVVVKQGGAVVADVATAAY